MTPKSTPAHPLDAPSSSLETARSGGVVWPDRRRSPTPTSAASSVRGTAAPGSPVSPAEAMGWPLARRPASPRAPPEGLRRPEHRADRVCGPEAPIDDEGLAACLGDGPAGQHGDEAERRARHRRIMQPTRLEQAPAPATPCSILILSVRTTASRASCHSRPTTWVINASTAPKTS